MIAKKFRLSVQAFPASAPKVFSGKIFKIKCSPNNLGHNRYAVVVAAGRVKGAVVRNFLKRRILARAAGLPNVSSDILFIVLSAPGLKHELDAEFDKMKTALCTI